jgi:hypothetical protein
VLTEVQVLRVLVVALVILVKQDLKEEMVLLDILVHRVLLENLV